MKLSDYAKELGISYKTAWRYFKNGEIDGAYQLPTGTVIVPDTKAAEKTPQGKVAVYARVSSSENKSNLETQADRVTKWATLNGFGVDVVVKEIGSGLNDSRPKLLKLLNDQNITTIVVEHKDRLTRFGFNFINSLMANRCGRIIVINQVETDKEDLLQDFVSVITSFCARIYGQRRSKRKTEELINKINEEPLDRE